MAVPIGSEMGNVVSQYISQDLYFMESSGLIMIV